MVRFMGALWILSSVILRKCMFLYYGFAYLFMASASRFSGHVPRQRSAVSGRFSPMSSMIVRHDR
ncbi:hypothetical protein QN277_010700 [Acacia crassicarpa]|uniref:Uncharacterized protein n=1 Tax=Acacia crassicarpa TaxID=499986 RepID=A0AAE1IP42_9FABA|nr:hypothetical protein QN277_010700 [Acacia crassicarpa]